MVAVSMTAAQQDRMLRNAVETDIELRKLSNGQYATRTSKTPNGITYLTTADSCTCQGFGKWGRCKHVAAVRFEQDNPEPPTPAAPKPAQWPQVDYCIAHQLDGTCDVVEFFIRRRGDVTRSIVGTYGSEEAARAAIVRAKARRQRGPLTMADCAVCDGWGCDPAGLACSACDGKGYVMAPVPTVAELIAAGRWPGQVVEIAA